MQLRILNEVGFERAKAKHNEAGDNRLLKEIKNHQEEILGASNKDFLAMLDHALNPKLVNRNGCLDVLTSFYNVKQIDVRE